MPGPFHVPMRSLEELHRELKELETERKKRDRTAATYTKLGAGFIVAVLILTGVIMYWYTVEDRMPELLVLLTQLSASLAIALLALAHLSSGRLSSVEADKRLVLAEILAREREDRQGSQSEDGVKG